MLNATHLSEGANAQIIGDLHDLVLLLVLVAVTVRYSIVGGAGPCRQGVVACHLVMHLQSAPVRAVWKSDGGAFG